MSIRTLRSQRLAHIYWHIWGHIRKPYHETIAASKLQLAKEPAWGVKRKTCETFGSFRPKIEASCAHSPGCPPQAQAIGFFSLMQSRRSPDTQNDSETVRRVCGGNDPCSLQTKVSRHQRQWSDTFGIGCNAWKLCACVFEWTSVNSTDVNDMQEFLSVRFLPAFYPRLHSFPCLESGCCTYYN